jgi:transcription antitermination factor NusG
MAGICAIEGVTGFVRAFSTIEVAGKPMDVSLPVALRPDDLSPIMQAELMGELDYTRAAREAREPRSTIVEGDRVKVRAGKWKGYLGRVVGMAKRKLVVETDWCRMEFKPDEVELAAAA